MASTDARPIPQKNVAYRVTFPILDADGDLVTGATGLDSEVSKDGGTFADCTNEATEIATSSGMYFLDLTSTEMNADCVAIIVKTSSAGAKTTPIVLYPEEGGDVRVNVTQWLGTAAATPTVAGVPEVDLTHIAGDAQSATDFKDFADAGYDPATNKVEGVKLADSLTLIAANGITATSLADGAIDAAALAADMDGYTGKLSVIDDDAGSADRWVMVWHKNGVPLSAGITSPTIQVVKLADNTDLVASTAMTQVGSTPFYQKVEATNRIVDGAAYGVIATATIGGISRTWTQIIGRPS